MTIYNPTKDKNYLEVRYMSILVKFLIVDDNRDSDLVLQCEGTESISDIQNIIENKINKIIKVKYIKF